jgi:hypothetical protein
MQHVEQDKNTRLTLGQVRRNVDLASQDVKKHSTFGQGSVTNPCPDVLALVGIWYKSNTGIWLAYHFKD